MHRLLAIVTTVALVLVAGASSIPTKTAAQGAFRLYLPSLMDPGLLAFVTDRDTGSSILALDVARGTEHSLTSPTTNDSAPQLSPDGSLVAFFTTRDGYNAAYVIDRDGGNPRKVAGCNICIRLRWAPDSRAVLLTEQVNRYEWPGGSWDEIVTSLITLDNPEEAREVGHHAAWSPEGQLLAFVEVTEAQRGLVIETIGSGEQVSVETDPGYIRDLTWSPDSTLLAFVVDTTISGYQLYVVPRTGGQARLLATGRELAWSPDSTQLAFLQDVASAPSRLALISTEGDQLSLLSERAVGLPVWSPDGSKIAFLQESYHPSRAVVVTPAGDVVDTFTPPGSPSAFTWSPDSSQLAFSTRSSERDAEVYLALPGGRLRPLGRGATPQWTPDGTHLLVARWIEAPPMIYSMPLETRQASPLTPGSKLVFAPDGRHLAYVHEHELYVIGSDGTGRSRLSTNLRVTARPAWSPDGTMLVFRTHNNEVEQLYLVRSDGRQQRHLVDCANWCSEPNWSPDGSTLLFATNDGIYLAPAAGEQTARLHDGAYPIWSSGGQQIFFIKPDGLWVMERDGSDARLLRPPPAPNFHYSHPRLSPDGTEIALVVWQTDSRESYSYTMIIRADTGEVIREVHTGGPYWPNDKPYIAYLRAEEFGFYEMAYYGTRSSVYYKLCLVASVDETCHSFPRGHGNVLSFDLVP